MTRPLIGITIAQRETGSAYLQQRATYPRAVESAGGLPVLIPPMAGDALTALLDKLDGILFPGGADIDPVEYGEAQHARTEVNADLDRLEFDVVGWALRHTDVPVLGICRGQQLLNVALGGTLLQHLDNHRQEGDRTALTQRLTVACDSRLKHIFGANQIDVNTLHHQAVRELGKGLRAVAWSDDGTIEAIESLDHPWLLMVQFHPEELVGFHAPSTRLLTAFVEASRVHALASERAAVR